ncbi:MAG: Ribosomal protein [Candidatus Parcubacteria bacterium]
MQDLRKKSDAELATLVGDARKTIQEERFKDTFSRKPATITKSKKDIARALTELSARRNNATK